MSEKLQPSEETGPRGGPQVDVALFSRVEQLLQSVRLTQEERIVVDTRDVASDVHSARKEYEMGHLDEALRAVSRVSAAFEQRVSQWEQRARKKESDKLKLSIAQIRKMHAEHTGVRTRVQLVKAQLRRLRGGLDQLVTQNAPASFKGPPAAEPPARTTEPREPPGSG